MPSTRDRSNAELSSIRGIEQSWRELKLRPSSWPAVRQWRNPSAADRGESGRGSARNDDGIWGNAWSPTAPITDM